MEEVELMPRKIREEGWPKARFLSKQEQEKYEESCERYSGKAGQSLNVPRKGSNLFKVLQLNQIGIRTATTPELELALENGLDYGFGDGREAILRSKKDSYHPNDYVAKDLAKKLGIKTVKNPLIVTGLGLEEDEASVYGLTLKPTDSTNIIEAPDFSHENNRRKFKRVNPDYTIEFSDKGITLWTREEGISRLCSIPRGLGSNCRDLANSGSLGRVVVVSGEATTQNLERYVKDLREKTQKQISEIQERARKAESYVRTGKLE